VDPKRVLSKCSEGENVEKTVDDRRIPKIHGSLQLMFPRVSWPISVATTVTFDGFEGVPHRRSFSSSAEPVDFEGGQEL
jgi:hypothetical protein